MPLWAIQTDTEICGSKIKVSPVISSLIGFSNLILIPGRLPTKLIISKDIQNERCCKNMWRNASPIFFHGLLSISFVSEIY